MVSKILSELQQELADEGEVLRWCVEWLEKLVRGEKVVVNLRASIDKNTNLFLLASFSQERSASNVC